MSAEFLPMVLDIEVSRHKRELADSFASLRKELTPPPKPESQLLRLMRAMTNANPVYNQIANQQMAAIYNSGNPLAGPYGQGLMQDHFGLALSGWNSAFGYSAFAPSALIR